MRKNRASSNSTFYSSLVVFKCYTTSMGKIVFFKKKSSKNHCIVYQGAVEKGIRTCSFFCHSFLFSDNVTQLAEEVGRENGNSFKRTSQNVCIFFFSLEKTKQPAKERQKERRIKTTKKVTILFFFFPFCFLGWLHCHQGS